jgi:ABC-type multidrug transport system ATPase subunit
VNDLTAVEQLTRRFGSRPCVTEISFEVAAGEEVFGFLGPDGAA